ncbi:MAG TPA: hypothetical protein RMH99_01670 [Sandaracinaceae bacterium LLY-WYZ-13_1]|nr:hypothetical protein [Sandaracinaceae bacterium LLY-WYZ-13_1]
MSEDSDRRPRRARSGVLAAQSPGGLRFAPVLCVPQRDLDLVEALRERLPRPERLEVVHTTFDLAEVQRRISAATFFGLGTGGKPHPADLLHRVQEAWRGVPRLWFGRYATPSIPPGWDPLLVTVRIDRQPYFDDTASMADRLAVECESGLAERIAQVAAARKFAELYGLSPSGVMLCVAISLRIPERRWSHFLGWDDADKVTRFLSRSLFKKTGLKSRVDLVSDVLGFEREYLSGHTGNGMSAGDR